MKETAQKGLQWDARVKKIAVLSGIVILLLAAAAMFQGGEDRFVCFWQMILPPLLGIFAFGMTGLILNFHAQWLKLKELEGLKYPLRMLGIQFVVYIYLFTTVIALYFLYLLTPESFLMRMLGSIVNVVIFMLALALASGGGGQLIINLNEDGIIYRDTVSKSKFSRQDLFFSQCGSWQDGLLIGWKRFPYADMRSYEVDKDCLIIRGQENGYRYGLVLYTPRIRKMVEKAIEGKI